MPTPATLPETMTAIEISEPGPPEALRPAVRPTPRPGSGEVLVHVAAAGVNRADVMQREGRYPPPPGASDIPGLEVAGTIAEVGGDVADVAVGDEVCTIVSGGGYAEYCVVPAPQCLPIPPAVSLRDAAALPEAYMTVWTNVFERGRLAAGETFLVHGGSSGIGTAAIPLAKLRGARVFTTAGSEEKCTACTALGADLAINYREQDFLDVVREATGGRGADVILDMVGGAYLQRNIDSLALEGRLVIIALMEGAEAELNLAAVMSKRLTVTGSTLRARRVDQKSAVARAVRQEVWPHLASGELRPMIHAAYPLADASEAHRVMQSSRHVGKLLLIP
ncbi:MAG: NAD(P)H-quinone oxidoreductase [Acidobacteria bacterium]|nr:NAD(P)H-quinone oxidoreductase [Acidobacteriota bacterium]